MAKHFWNRIGAKQWTDIGIYLAFITPEGRVLLQSRSYARRFSVIPLPRREVYKLPGGTVDEEDLNVVLDRGYLSKYVEQRAKKELGITVCPSFLNAPNFPVFRSFYDYSCMLPDDLPWRDWRIVVAIPPESWDANKQRKIRTVELEPDELVTFHKHGLLPKNIVGAGGVLSSYRMQRMAEAALLLESTNPEWKARASEILAPSKMVEGLPDNEFYQEKG